MGWQGRVRVPTSWLWRIYSIYSKPLDTRLQHAKVWSAAKLLQRGIAMVARFRTFLCSRKAAGRSMFVRFSARLCVEPLYSAYSA